MCLHHVTIATVIAVKVGVILKSDLGNNRASFVGESTTNTGPHTGSYSEVCVTDLREYTCLINTGMSA